MQSGIQLLNDEQLIQLLKTGHYGAFDVLYRRYAAVLQYESFRVVGCRDSAEDVVQNVFARFWQCQHYRDVQSSVKPFLSRCVRNESINVLRYRKRQSKLLFHSALHTRYSEHHDPAEARETGRLVQRAHQLLPPRQAQAFRLAFMEHRKQQDVAVLMGISLNSVKTHVRLALLHMQRELEQLR